MYLVETWREVTPNEISWIKPNAYKVSSFGQVYSYLRNIILTGYTDDLGYQTISLRTADPNDGYDGARYMRVHRLVMMIFNPIPNPENFMVHHIDCNPSNNRLDNLMWVTRELHAIMGMNYGNFHPDIFNAGEHCGTHVLTEKQVLEIVDLINSEKYSLTDIGKMYNVSESTIHSIAHHYHWKCLNFEVNNMRKSDAFTNEELDKIYKFFETHDINNTEKYKTQRDIFEACFEETGLGEKYEYKHKRKQLHRILTKHGKYDKLSNDYNFDYNVPLRVSPKRKNLGESSTTNENIDT